MTLAPEVEQARALIRKREFEQARQLLESVADSDAYAADLLLHLDIYIGEPPPRWQFLEFDQTARRALIGIWFVAFVILLVWLFFYLRQEQAEEANEGSGALSNPIPFGTDVHFDPFDVTILEVRFPASQDVRRIAFPYNAPAPGNEYMLVRVAMLCKRESPAQCGGRQINIRVVDDTGEEWGKPILPLLSGGLDMQFGSNGSRLEGWVLFQFPLEGRKMQAIKLWTLAGPTLYVAPPAGM